MSPFWAHVKIAARTASSASQETAFAHDQRHAIHLLACIFAKCSPVVKVFFTGKFSNKFVKTRLLKVSHLKCVATLPCDLSLTTTLVWECRLFSGTDVLQGSVATRMRCDGIFNNSFIANVLDNLSVKQSVKSVKVWQSYSHEFLASLLWDPV